MKVARYWFKYGIIGTLLLTMICTTAFILRALTSQANIKAGIATFRFNFTGLTFSDHSPKVKRVSQPDIVQSFQNGVQSAASSAATEIPGAVSQVQSAASTLSTGIPDSIEALIPQNLSIGTKKFCVGLTHNVSCNALPLNLSSLLPTDAQKYLKSNLSDIGSLDSGLMKITPKNVYRFSILGLILMVVMIIVSICLMSFRLVCLSIIPGAKIMRFGVLLLLGAICCTLFVIPVVILSILNSKAKQLPSWIQVEHGEVGKLSLWSLSFVIIAAIASVLSPIAS